MKRKKIMLNKKKLKVFGKDISLKYNKDLCSFGIAGLYSSDKLMIEYGNHPDKDDLMKTLLHELIHSVCDITGINQTSLSNDLQEIISENVSQAIGDNFHLRLK